MEEIELSAAAGFVDPALQAEFPGLRLSWLTREGRQSASPPSVRRRLRNLSNRYRGANVVAMRTQPVPHAYRAFFHQVGLDPDATRIPSEQAAVDRLLHGQFRSQNLISDALLIAVVETGVPVWALDASAVETGGLGIRLSRKGERLGSSQHAHHLPPGRLVIADAANVHAVLFGDIAPGHGVSSRTRRIALFAVGVEGVPAIHVEEALWIAVEVLGGASSEPGAPE
jgi:DNA/RNA-binding domain of Phe-tRNA-synthetase-like protein